MVKRLVIRLGLGLLGLAALVGAWVAWQLNDRPGLEPYAAHWLPPAPALDASAAAAAPLRITFLGVATVLLDDGETPLLIDGFFTRPSMARVVFGRVAPDPDTIRRQLAKAGIQRLAAVITVHSHYDHAMDTPEVARQTGALVIGSASTANVARGAGLAEDRIRTVDDGARLQFGRWQVTVIGSRHLATGFTGGTIDEPLKPPVRATRYAEGGSYSLLLRNGARSLLVQGSAGFIQDKLQGQKADVVLLGVGALGKQDDRYLAQYWAEVVAQVGAKRVIPIHWDDFTLPLDEPLRPGPRLLDDFEHTMRFLLDAGRRERIDVKLAPAGVAVDPFAGL
ncbi:MBL fold metallo-hydrolase [Aquabacterium humicola]|uniref:MBL fold metallo-hydrolase n=1 Tax=Aquabacterium humicola TaxID=3237377 RepID=UPI0025427339|nr:MBL fold metallo-hydrolase [Rubrivivax pictus]